MSSYSPHAEGNTDVGITNGTIQTTPPESLVDVLGSLSRTEADLARQFTARVTCSQQFEIYVDTFDIPISECLAGGSMPPRYSLGVTACTPLENSA